MEGDTDGRPCAQCGEEIPNEHFDMCDEKYGGELFCPHCGAHTLDGGEV